MLNPTTSEPSTGANVLQDPVKTMPLPVDIFGFRILPHLASKNLPLVCELVFSDKNLYSVFSSSPYLVSKILISAFGKNEALVRAARSGRVHLTKILIDNFEPNIYREDPVNKLSFPREWYTLRSNFPALMYACLNADAAMIDLLCETYRIPPEVLDEAFETVASKEIGESMGYDVRSTRSERLKAVDLLCGKYRANVRRKSMKMPLGYLARSGRVEMIDFLCEKYGAHECRFLTWIMLVQAAECIHDGNAEVVDLLLGKYGAKLDDAYFNDHELESDFPLYQAFKYGNRGVIDVICLKYGVDPVGLGFIDGLRWGAVVGNRELVEMSLPDGADTSTIETALRFAACYGQAEIIEYLLAGKYGANLKCDASDALRLAAANGHAHVVDLLIEKYNVHIHGGEPVERAIRAAICNGHDEIAATLKNRKEK